MTRYKTFALSAAAALGLMISAAHANKANFTSHHLVPQKDYARYAEDLSGKKKLELRKYLDYEHREPCQNYRPPPAGFVRDGCDLTYPRKQVDRFSARKVETRTMELRPVVSDYTIYFGFDEAHIRDSEQATLARVVREIEQYDPYEVTIVGHADRSGPASYNIGLSRQRAQRVSEALTARGIPNRILGKQAEGENEPAVPTRDGVRLQENRRVEIQFRK